VWAGRRFRSVGAELVAVWETAGGPEGLTVVMEPTRTAWAPVAAFFRAQGATVVLVPPERAADTLLVRSSRGAWREDKTDDLLLAARGTIELWADGGIDFAGVAADVESEVPMAQLPEAEIARVDDRIEALYGKADPAGTVLSAPRSAPAASPSHTDATGQGAAA
jgi:hypothetical protein